MDGIQMRHEKVLMSTNKNGHILVDIDTCIV
jgi:hypothetical protein